jgi:hypothetical protein
LDHPIFFRVTDLQRVVLTTDEGTHARTYIQTMHNCLFDAFFFTSISQNTFFMNVSFGVCLKLST